MLRIWPILFVIVPLVELYLIIQVGSVIGALWTVLLVVLTAMIGVSLLRIQGVGMLERARRNMEAGTLPALEMMEGIMLAVGGALLITPGFITDALGFLCLIPVTRRAMIAYIARHSTIHARGFYAQDRGPRGTARGTRGRRQGRTIEGEFQRKD